MKVRKSTLRRAAMLVWVPALAYVAGYLFAAGVMQYAAGVG